MKKQIFSTAFTLESGQTIDPLDITFYTSGSLSLPNKKVIWIFHSSLVYGNPSIWLDHLVGENKPFDPSKYFIISVDLPGTSSSSTNAFSINKASGEPFYHEFPYFSISDYLKIVQTIAAELKIETIEFGVGFELGSAIALQWSLKNSKLFKNLILHSPFRKLTEWHLNMHVNLRNAIELDPTWNNRNDRAGIFGANLGLSFLTKARQLNFLEKQINNNSSLYNDSNAFYLFNISLTLDSFRLDHNFKSDREALQSISASTLLIGIMNDPFFVSSEARWMADYIPKCALRLLNSDYGHDGIFLEKERTKRIILDFMEYDHHPKTNDSTRFLQYNAFSFE